MYTKHVFKIKSYYDGLSLSAMAFVPNEIIAVIQICHGMAEHKERYETMMKFLAENKVMSVIMDHRGHGESVRDEADLGFFYDDIGDGIVEDAHQLTMLVKNKVKDVPYVLFGHSMGSLVARCYLQHYDQDIDGCIICGSPSLNRMAKIGKKMVSLMMKHKGGYYRSTLIHNMAFSHFNKNFKAEFSENAWISKNVDNVQSYDEDPKCGFMFTLNGFYNLFHLMIQAYDVKKYSFQQPNLKILFVAGSDDPCIISEGKFKQAVFAMGKVGYKNISVHLFPTLRHEIFLEKEYQQVFDTIFTWLKLQILQKTDEKSH